MKILDNLDLGKGALQNAAIQGISSAPANSPVIGQIYYDTVAGALRTHEGAGVWSLKATDSALLGGQNGAYYLARANHTGTQLASTISNLAAVVQGYRLDQFAAPTNPVPFNNQRITGLGAPQADDEAANKLFVMQALENAAAGIDSKASVRVVVAANITLSGAQTIDGVSLANGDRVLVAGQTDKTKNGVYTVAAGAWPRAADADANGEITPGAFWYVEEGGAYGKTQWRCNNTGSVTIGTTDIIIYQFGAAAIYAAGNGLSLTGSVFAAVAKPLGGLVSASDGLSVDTTIVARKYPLTIGDGSNTSYVVTHNLGTRDVTVSIRDASTNEGVWTKWIATDINSVTVTFREAPAVSAYRVVVSG